MEHSLTLLDGNCDSLTFTLLNGTFVSSAICWKITSKWLKSQKVKVPLRHPKKWWPPICTKIGPQIVESPKFHINTLLWTFFSQKAFKSEFESRVPFRSVKLDAHSASRFYNYESSMIVRKIFRQEKCNFVVNKAYFGQLWDNFIVVQQKLE